MMDDAGRTILVFGATGRQGGSVTRALMANGWKARALVRDTAAPASVALRDTGVALAKGSLADTDAIRAAMAGVHGVFSVLPAGLPDGDEVRFGTAIADVAADLGIAHFVYSSGASAGEELTGVPRFDAKPRIEAHIRDLPLKATIVRPMIFMEMLFRPGSGLDEGRFPFFLRLDQRLVAAVFADEARFVGQTLRLASDTVTGRDLQEALSEAAGRPIKYSRFPDEVLAASPDLAHMSKSLESGPLAKHADLDLMRDLNPQLLTLRACLAGSGREALNKALGAVRQGG